ncbi:MAG: leucine-rich repeat domain-containing protein [Sedimentisphaerales bacterium]
MVKLSSGRKKKRLSKITGSCVLAAAAALLLVFAYEFNSSRTQSYKESEANLNKIAARELDKFPGSLTNEDFLRLESVRVYENELTNIKPLAKLKNLHTISFYVAPNHDLDFRPLGKLEKLKTLRICNGGGNVVNVSLPGKVVVFFPIRKKRHWYVKVFSFFRRLEPAHSKTKSFDPGQLRELRQLESLTIQEFYLRNFEALAALTNLEYLGLDSTEIKDINSLANLKNLRELDLSNTKVTDLNALKTLTGLKNLSLRDVSISDDEIAELQKALPGLKIQR